MKNSEKNLMFFYYFLTYLIVCCAPIALMSLISFWQMGTFAVLVAIGLGFSARAGTEIKQRFRTTAGLLLSITLIVFLIKSPPQQAILPDLMRFFLIVIVISSFMVKNSFTLSLVHFETIFFVIFSACLPLSMSAHIRILLFGVLLFLSIFLLRLTHSLAPESSADIFAVAGSVSIIRSFFLSLIIMTSVILIAWPLLAIVPKFSLKFNLDRAGSSLVDFKIMPDESSRLNLSPGERIDDLEEGDLVSYIRSLFYPNTKKDSVSKKKRQKWQQPLTWEKQKQIKVSEKERQEGSGFQKSSFVGDAGGLGPNKKEQNDDRLTILESEKKLLQEKREALMRRIQQEKKLHKMLQYLGKNDPLQKEKAEAVGNRLAEDLQGLAELESKIKELEQRIKKDKSFLLAKGALKNGDGKGRGKGNDKGSGDKRGQEEGIGKGKGKGAGEEPGEDDLKGEFDGIGGEGTGKEGKGDGKDKDTGAGKGESTGEGQEGTDEGQEGAGEGQEGAGEGQEGTGEGREGTGEGTGEGKGEGTGKGQDEGQEGTDESKDKEDQDESTSEDSSRKSEAGDSAGDNLDKSSEGTTDGVPGKKLDEINKRTGSAGLKDNQSAKEPKHKPELKRRWLPNIVKSIFEMKKNGKMTSLVFVLIIIALLCLLVLIFGMAYLLLMLLRKIVRDLWMRYLIFGGSGLIILHIYRNLRFVFCRSGIKLERWMSPKEIFEFVADSFSYLRKELFLITNIFNKVRYSNHTVEKDDIIKAIVSYDEISKEQFKNMHGLKKFMFWLRMFSLPKIKKGA